ncbi:unnamed protein product, partial [Thlaspi arvense]
FTRILYPQDLNIPNRKPPPAYAPCSNEMAHRYSTAEKGKWILVPSQQERRTPIKIPESDNSALIEENKLILIGRVMNPLVQKPHWLPISLPSREVIWITLEYEKLEKHCFHCYSLMHEEKECPLKPANTTTEQTTRGINQLNTVSTLEEYKRRNQNRLGDLPPRRPEASQNREISSYHHRDLQPRERDQSHSDNRRDCSPRKSRVLEERLRYPPHWDSHRNASCEYNRPDDRASSRGDSRLHLKERTPQYFRPIARNDKEPSSKAGSKSENADITSPPRFISDIQGNLHRTTPQPSQRTQISHTPSPTPLREPMLLPSHTEVGEGIIPSAQRRSALDRISSQSPPVPPRSHEGSSLLSERLQEVEIQYDEIIGGQTNEIRSSVEHIHSSLRLGAPTTLKRKPARQTTKKTASTSKTIAKKRSTGAKGKSIQSPLQGANTRKRLTTLR